MADKENQWEDLEYSEDTNNTADYGGAYETEEENPNDNEYSEEEYDDTDDSEEEYEEDEINQDTPKKSNAKVLIILIILFLLLGLGIMLLLAKQKGAGDSVSTAQNPPAETIQQNPQNNPDTTNDMTDMFFEQAGGNSDDMVNIDFSNSDGSANVTTQGDNGEIVANVSSQPQPAPNANENTDLVVPSPNNNDALDLPEPEANNSIMVSYNPTARQNPFKPPVITAKDDESYKLLNNTGFEIIEPPVTSVADENLTKLLQTQISGILYDEVSPSAIVNLNGTDQFVKIGDVISGYKIQNITRDKVQISYKNNSYVAAVGELFTRGALEKQRAVANLESKFAGRYKSNNN